MTTNQARQVPLTDADRARVVDVNSKGVLSQTAESHIGLLRTYFGFQAYVGAVGLPLIPFARFLKPLFVVNGNPWVVIPVLAINTWAAFRTRRLLQERDREGAWMAGATFGWNLIVARSAGHLGSGALLSAVGILLAANVYTELRRSELAGHRAPTA